MNDKICKIKTSNGLRCKDAVWENFPCCWSHIPKWVSENSENFKTFLDSGIFRISSNRKFYIYNDLIFVLLENKYKKNKKKPSINLYFPICDAEPCANSFYLYGHWDISLEIIKARDEYLEGFTNSR